jgi:hypothetical protein
MQLVRYSEAAFYHRRSESVLVTDAAVYVVRGGGG